MMNKTATKLIRKVFSKEGDIGLKTNQYIDNVLISRTD